MSRIKQFIYWKNHIIIIAKWNFQFLRYISVYTSRCVWDEVEKKCVKIKNVETIEFSGYQVRLNPLKHQTAIEMLSKNHGKCSEIKKIHFQRKMFNSHNRLDSRHRCWVWDLCEIIFCFAPKNRCFGVDISRTANVSENQINVYGEHRDSAHLSSYNQIHPIYRFCVINRKASKIDDFRVWKVAYEADSTSPSQLFVWKVNFVNFSWISVSNICAMEYYHVKH